LSINSDINNIPADSAAMIRTSGLLGEQYIDISIGGDLESLQPGDNFYTTQSAMNIERLISNFASGR
jgi:phospholipid/cholesterol/gamma-HCH transport system substrate-binding protein